MQELRSCKSAGLKLAGIHDLAAQAQNLEAPHFGGLHKTTLPDSNFQSYGKILSFEEISDMLLVRTTRSEIEDRQETPKSLSAEPYSPCIFALDTVLK